MKLTFLGTRGNIKNRTKEHDMHSALLVSYHGKKVMIDCGDDWQDEVFNINPHAIVITHAHPDHSWGLKNGAPCAVFATRESWESMQNYGIDKREEIKDRVQFYVFEIKFEAFAVEHSTIAPAVGYKICAGNVCIFYAPDLVYIHERKEALRNVTVYIGDGAALVKSFIRKRGENLIGHVPVRIQLTWCKKENVPKAIITHCGSEIVTGNQEEIHQKLEKMARERDVSAEIANDGMEFILR